MRKEFVVIGLGRFGGGIVKELIAQGADVMAIDLSPERVDAVSYTHLTLPTMAVV